MRRGSALLLGLGLLLAAPAGAWPVHVVKHLCLRDALFMTELVKSRSVPLGCRVIDCCPGCPAGAPLDWRVRLEGRLVEGLSIRGLPAAAKHGGGATPIPDGVVVRGREGWLRQIPQSPGAVPLARLQLRLDPKVLAEIDAAGPAAPTEKVSIFVEQWLGNVLVNGIDFEFRLSKCSTPNTCDRIEQLNKQGGEPSAIALDGSRLLGCSEDVIYDVDGVAEVGDVRQWSTASSCNSEIGVYNESNAMELIHPETSWRNGCGDVVQADLDPILVAPVTIWKMGAVGSQVGENADEDLAYAMEVFRTNRSGISFDPKYAWGSDAGGALTALATACQLPFVQPSFYDSDRLNVYYLPSVVSVFLGDGFLRRTFGSLFEELEPTGISCGADRNIIIIGTDSNQATLAHEFGHAFSLHGGRDEWAHVNDLYPTFTDENVMWAGGPASRDVFTLGQSFRFNVNGISMLNENGVRTGQIERDCKPKDGTNPPNRKCPALDMDWR